MKIGDKISIGKEEFKVLFLYKNYILACIEAMQVEDIARGTFVFEKTEDNKIKIVQEKEIIREVISKLFEAAQGKV